MASGEVQISLSTSSPKPGHAALGECDPLEHSHALHEHVEHEHHRPHPCVQPPGCNDGFRVRVDSESFHHFGGPLNREPEIPGLSGLVQDVLHPLYLGLSHKGYTVVVRGLGFNV